MVGEGEGAVDDVVDQWNDVVAAFVDVRHFLVKITSHLDEAQLALRKHDKDVATKLFELKEQLGGDPGTLAKFSIPSVWEGVGIVHDKVCQLRTKLSKKIDTLTVNVPAIEKRFGMAQGLKERMSVAAEERARVAEEQSRAMTRKLGGLRTEVEEGVTYIIHPNSQANILSAIESLL